MKNLIVVLLSLIIVNCYAQKAAPTTQEEYTYLTKGYKTQVESGLDMKKGYRMEDYGTSNDAGRALTFKGLFRDNESKPCAVLMIYKKGPEQDYICIPTADAPGVIWDSFFGACRAFTADNLSWIDYYMARTLMGLCSK